VFEEGVDPVNGCQPSTAVNPSFLLVASLTDDTTAPVFVVLGPQPQ
jgi:hypothetical protein